MNDMIQFFRELHLFKRFKKEMRDESKRLNSKFTQLNLKRNWLGNIVYTQINCSDEDLMNADYSTTKMLEIKLKPYVEYLSKDLGWGEYLVPDISNFVNEDDNESSLSYAVMFMFNGYTFSIKKLLVFNIINALVVIGGIVTALILI